MKKIFSSIIIFASLWQSTFAQIVILRPSLTAQMTRQEGINNVNFALERKLKNQMRLAELREIRQAKLQKKTIPVTSPSPQKPITKSSLPPPSYTVSSNIPWVDMNRVRSTWLDWYNTTRKSLSLGGYSYDSRLDATAADWNRVFAAGKWENHHRRNPWDSYYDFPVIDAWFGARGINPKVINRAKNTENVGYGYYSCTASDCTDELIASIRSTYNFYMSEKGKSYDAHYRSIVQPYFTKIGLDIIVVPGERRYYMTIHYITE